MGFLKRVDADVQNMLETAMRATAHTSWSFHGGTPSSCPLMAGAVVKEAFRIENVPLIEKYIAAVKSMKVKHTLHGTQVEPLDPPLPEELRRIDQLDSSVNEIFCF